jgi:hypothetical protein
VSLDYYRCRTAESASIQAPGRTGKDSHRRLVRHEYGSGAVEPAQPQLPLRSPARVAAVQTHGQPGVRIHFHEPGQLLGLSRVKYRQVRPEFEAVAAVLGADELKPLAAESALALFQHSGLDAAHGSTPA